MDKLLKRDQLTYFTLVGIYCLFLAILLVLYGYKGSFLMLNGLHLPFLDYPMFILTHFGDALILTSVLALFLVRKHPHLVLLVIVAVALSGLFGQVLKNTVFDDWGRPLRVFAETGGVHTVAGYKMYHHTFPSGHSIVTAAAFTTLVLNLDKSRLSRIWPAFAVMLISYTRIYVGVHFAGDVLAGTLIGIAGAMLVTAWLGASLERRINGMPEKASRRMKLWLTGIAVVCVGIGVSLVAAMLKNLIVV